MKELKLKIKREYYNIFKELNDRQAGELVKGMCAYMYDNKPFFTKDAYLKGVFMTVRGTSTKQNRTPSTAKRARKSVPKDGARRQWQTLRQSSAK